MDLKDFFKKSAVGTVNETVRELHGVAYDPGTLLFDGEVFWHKSTGWNRAEGPDGRYAEVRDTVGQTPYPTSDFDLLDDIEVIGEDVNDPETLRGRFMAQTMFKLTAQVNRSFLGSLMNPDPLSLLEEWKKD